MLKVFRVLVFVCVFVATMALWAALLLGTTIFLIVRWVVKSRFQTPEETIVLRQVPVVPAGVVELCECFKHGYYLFSGGSRSLEFCSREGATQELKRFSAGKDDCILLAEEMAKLDILPESDDEVGELIRLTRFNINVEILMGECYDDSSGTSLYKCH
ncbi:MAG: hypothetical protein EXS69_00745 [Candidatus Zambryskibacteria bacterium]|nr:hypothetical protein [Candidatus Zambryskibacteria bacterium]